MKKSLLFLILNSQFLILNSFSQSPNWLWAKSMGGTSYEYCNSIAIGPAGSGAIYTTGRFNGTVDFDPGASVFNLTAGGNDIFISKLDSSGNFVWAKAMGGTGGDGEGYSVAIDPGSGAVYTTGDFQGTADFDPGAGVFNLTSAGSDDIFISKLDSSGNFVWAKAMGGTNQDIGYSVAIDPTGSGAVYTTGAFGGTVDFDPGAGVFNITAGGSDDIFISKLDSSGNFVWAKAMGGTSQDKGFSIAIDSAGSGDVYTTGYFYGTADFDPDSSGIFNLISTGGENIFISKLDNSGSFIWAKATGGGMGFSIAIDPAGSGNVHTTGYFAGTADFDPGVGIFNLTSAGGNDIFISKLDASGNFVWAKALGGTSYQYGNSIAIDPAGSGDAYTTGNFNGTVDFDPGAGVFNLTSAGGSDDIFISKLDSSGNFIWVKAMGGISNDVGNSIAIDASGNVHLTGYFNSPSISFSSTTLTNTGGSDIFIARLDTITIITGNNEIENFGKGVLTFPNPVTNITTISFSLTQSQKVSLKIFDVSGRLVSILADKVFDAGENELVWNAGDVNAGIYFLRFEAASYSENQKLIVAK
ncbi:MAG: T9SS type A sorting domain-containing protein [Bacteroidia bacterium]|nr:T9SS type A sorting domain-containing protein [Bacteroidia bacterium]